MTIMSDGLKEILGIEGSEQTQEGIPPEDFQVDGGEFDEYKDTPRPEVKFEIVEKPTCVPDLDKSDAKTDYAFARSLNYTLINMTTEALSRALAVVKETEHPRAFESYNSLAMTVRGLTQDLLALQKIYKEITKGRPEMDALQVTTTNVTINGNVNNNTGRSTVDVLSMLQEAIDKGEIQPMAGAIVASTMGDEPLDVPSTTKKEE